MTLVRIRPNTGAARHSFERSRSLPLEPLCHPTDLPSHPIDLPSHSLEDGESSGSDLSDISNDVDFDNDLEPKFFSSTGVEDSTPQAQIAASPILDPVSAPIGAKPSPFRVTSYNVTHSSFIDWDQHGRKTAAQLTTTGRELTLPPNGESLFHWMYVGPSNLINSNFN